MRRWLWLGGLALVVTSGCGGTDASALAPEDVSGCPDASWTRSREIEPATLVAGGLEEIVGRWWVYREAEAPGAVLSLEAGGTTLSLRLPLASVDTDGIYTLYEGRAPNPFGTVLSGASAEARFVSERPTGCASGAEALVVVPLTGP